MCISIVCTFFFLWAMNLFPVVYLITDLYSENTVFLYDSTDFCMTTIFNICTLHPFVIMGYVLQIDVNKKFSFSLQLATIQKKIPTNHTFSYISHITKCFQLLWLVYTSHRNYPVSLSVFFCDCVVHVVFNSFGLIQQEKTKRMFILRNYCRVGRLCVCQFVTT